MNYINDTTDTKKGKKKYKKGRKNKNKNFNKEEEEEKDKEEINNINNNEDQKGSDEFDIQFENFKNDILNNTVYVYEINEKIKPCLSENFLNSISMI